MYGLIIPDISNLKDWRIIFDNWFKEIETILELSNGTESPYIHAEHGNINLFSVSASKAGFGTILELLGGNREEHNARLDLCIIGKNNLDIIEAKWLEFECSNYIPKEKIINIFRRALNDAKNYQNKNPIFIDRKKEIRKIGILFLSPYFENTVNFKKAEQLIDLFSKSDDINYDLLAWSFPAKALHLKYWNRFYPGTIFIAKKI